MIKLKKNMKGSNEKGHNLKKNTTKWKIIKSTSEKILSQPLKKNTAKNNYN